MPKAVRLYGRELTVAGSDDDDYFRHIVDGADLTDPVLRALEPVVADGSVCFDVGANIGLYSLGLSQLTPNGRVFAFEPSPGAFEWLRRNLTANGVTNVEAVHGAASDRVGTIAFHDVAFFTAGSFTAEEGSYLDSEAVGSTLVEVPCTTLDAFVESSGVERVDVLKIDVEGAELAVLEGAERTLAEHQPTVVMEFNSFGFYLHQAVLPQVALSRIQETFPHVFVIDRVDGSLARLTTAAQAYQFLYLNGIHGPADNLLCSFTDLPVERAFRLPDAASGPPPPAPQTAVAELERMKRTVSWRITAPLRAARTRIDRQPALRELFRKIVR
ncbi:MAG TPA: FkbM family methyltransferase [Acidimicrobiales bacterium]|nr:FkbM family methyltransferase [Acidimicrobiales bacterium]